LISPAFACLERLEARQPSAAPWRDPHDAAMAIWAALQGDRDAERAGRPFSRLLSPDLPETEALALGYA
jgi:hypothetical protein